MNLLVRGARVLLQRLIERGVTSSSDPSSQPGDGTDSAFFATSPRKFVCRCLNTTPVTRGHARPSNAASYTAIFESLRMESAEYSERF